MLEEKFWDNFNVACTLLKPDERKLVNQVLKTCDEFSISFLDAARLAEEDPSSLPPPVYGAMQKVDPIFDKIIGFFLGPN